MKLWHLAGVRCARKGAGRATLQHHSMSKMDIRAVIPLLALKAAARLLNECDHRSFASNIDYHKGKTVSWNYY